VSNSALVLLALLALVPVASAAQVRVVRSGDDRLTGIDQVDLLIVQETAPPACRPAAPTLQDAARQALTAAGIRVSVSEKARSWHYSVVVTMRSERGDSGCISSIATELVAEVAGIPEADKDLPPDRWGSWLKGFIPLVRESALVIGKPVAHDAAVQQAIRTHTAAIAARIRSVNPY
jgi:hypothetical protein